MKLPGYSIAELLATVALLALGFACLLDASSMWAGLAMPVTMAILLAGPVAIAYRRGRRRSFWLGFSIYGWAYMALCYGPWPAEALHPSTITARLLKWAYPSLIPERRRPPGSHATEKSRFVVTNPAIQEAVGPFQDYRGLVDVWAEGGDGRPVKILVAGAEKGASSSTGERLTQVTIMVDAEQAAALDRAESEKVRFIVLRSRSGPPVEVGDFLRVGNALLCLVVAWAGSLLGRYFHATREPESASPGL